MNTRRNIPTAVYKVLLVFATIIWGLSFVIMKDTVEVMEPATLIGIRFLATGIILAALFQRRLRAGLSKDNVIKGSILGILLFLAFWIQTIGVANTTPGKNAFLTATYCVIVPFAFWVVARRRPTVYNVAAAVLCVVGIGLVSMQGSLSIEYGDAMTLVCAVFYAIHIVYVAKFSGGRDIYVLTVIQFLAGGVGGTVLGLATEPLPSLAAVTPDFLFNMVYLVVFASCIALLIQNVALAHVPPAQASLFLSLESVFGVLFSVLLYGEQVGLQMVAGFVLILVSIVVSETFPIKPSARRGEEAPELPREDSGASTGASIT